MNRNYSSRFKLFREDSFREGFINDFRESISKFYRGICYFNELILISSVDLFLKFFIML